MDEGDRLVAKPEKILYCRMIRRGNRAITQALVKWSSLDEADATWMDYWALKNQFPDFDP